MHDCHESIRGGTSADVVLLTSRYAEKALPGGYGPRLHWTFIFRPSYWSVQCALRTEGWLAALARTLLTVYHDAILACSLGLTLRQRS